MKHQGNLIFQTEKTMNTLHNHGRIHVFRGKKHIGYIDQEPDQRWKSNIFLENNLMIQGISANRYSDDYLEYPNETEAKRQITRAHNLLQETRIPLRLQNHADEYHVFYAGLKVGKVLKIHEKFRCHTVPLNAVEYRYGMRYSPNHDLPYYWILDSDLCRRLDITIHQKPSSVTFKEIRRFLCLRLYDNTPKPHRKIQREIRRSQGKLAALIRQMTYSERIRRGKWIATRSKIYP